MGMAPFTARCNRRCLLIAIVTPQRRLHNFRPRPLHQRPVALPHTASFKLSAPTCVHSSSQNARLWFVPIVQELRDLSRKYRDPISVAEKVQDVIFGSVASIGFWRSASGVGFNVTHPGLTFPAQALTDPIGDVEATEFVAPVAVGRHRAHGLRLATKMKAAMFKGAHGEI